MGLGSLALHGQTVPQAECMHSETPAPPPFNTELNNIAAETRQFDVPDTVNTTLAELSSSNYTLDGSGRILTLQTTTNSNFNGNSFIFADGALASAGQVQTDTYAYSYNGEGQVTLISATGSGTGTSAMTYNADGEEIDITQGEGNGMTSAETSQFIYNTAGQIVFQIHNDGQSTDLPEDVHYEYDASGTQVGEYGWYADDTGAGNPVADPNGRSFVYLDGGSYAQVQQAAPVQVGTGQSGYTATGGENLAQVAQTVYGNAALWYLLANANGLTENSTLKAGEQLSVPSSSVTGMANSTTGKVYNANALEGSNLPNIKTPQPPSSGSGCSTWGEILLVVIAVIVVIVTEGAGAEDFGAVLPDGTAVAGTAVGGGGAAAVTTGGISGAFSTGLSVIGSGATIGGSIAATVAVGAAAGIAGSVVSQEVGHAANSNLHFSLAQAAEAGVTAGATAGITAGIGGAPTTFGGGFATGVAINAATQEAAIGLKLQQRFNWAQTAAAGIVGGANAGFASQDIDNALSSVGAHRILTTCFH